MKVALGLLLGVARQRLSGGSKGLKEGLHGFGLGERFIKSCIEGLCGLLDKLRGIKCGAGGVNHGQGYSCC